MSETKTRTRAEIQTEARMDTPAALTHLTREYALDGDTGPRRYTRIYDGKAYVVTVEAAGAEPAYHDDPATNRAMAKVFSELKAMTPEALVELLQSSEPGPIAALIQAAGAEPADAEPVGWAHLFDDGEWSPAYRDKDAARIAAENLRDYNTMNIITEVAVPLYRHPAPQPSGNSGELAVAPVGVVEELRTLRDVMRNVGQYGGWADITDRALARITELPPPSDWARVTLANHLPHKPNHRECLDLMAALAALLESEAECD